MYVIVARNNLETVLHAGHVTTPSKGNGKQLVAKPPQTPDDKTKPPPPAEDNNYTATQTTSGVTNATRAASVHL